MNAPAKITAADKLTRQETREYLADLEWEECEPCGGTGCPECGGEGIVWETTHGD